MIWNTLVFDMRPMGKGVAQFAGHAFTPAKTREYMTELGLMAREQFQLDPYTGPLCVKIACVFPTQKKERWGTWHFIKPDADNIEKALFDALKGIVWRDDCLIADHRTTKHWGPEACITVTFYELELTEKEKRIP